MRRNLFLAPLLVAASVVLADDAPEAKKPDPGATETEAQSAEGRNLGMSILGNQEAPKALVIVPWKASELGASLGISTMLDDSKQPVDKEVFMRSLIYYEMRSTTTHHDGAPAGGRDAAAAEGDASQPATAAHRRKS